MEFYGFRRNRKAICDFFCGQSFRDQASHILLSFGQGDLCLRIEAIYVLAPASLRTRRSNFSLGSKFSNRRDWGALALTFTPGQLGRSGRRRVRSPVARLDVLRQWVVGQGNSCGSIGSESSNH